MNLKTAIIIFLIAIIAPLLGYIISDRLREHGPDVCQIILLKEANFHLKRWFIHNDGCVVAIRYLMDEVDPFLYEKNQAKVLTKCNELTDDNFNDMLLYRWRKIFNCEE